MIDFQSLINVFLNESIFYKNQLSNFLFDCFIVNKEITKKTIMFMKSCLCVFIKNRLINNFDFFAKKSSTGF